MTSKTKKCWQHLEKEDHLRIKKSSIPRAGDGLYTTVRRKKGERITTYDGQVVVNPPADWGGAYVLQLKKHPPTFVDAKRTDSAPGRYSNNCRRGQCVNNAHMRPTLQRGVQGSIKATRPIAAGKEVYTAYGRSYWNQ